MIEMNYSQLYQPGFISLIQKLAKTEGFPAKTAYRVGKIAQGVLRTFTVADTKRIDVLGKYAKKDDSGAWVKSEAGDIEFMDKESAAKEVDQLLQTKFTVEQLPLELDTLDAAKLSPAEILLLDFMLKE